MKYDIESMITQAEAALYIAPPGFTASVMRRLPGESATVKVPMLNRRLAAAVCFTGAIMIMLVTMSGFNWRVVTEHSDKINEWVSYTQNLITGGIQ